MKSIEDLVQDLHHPDHNFAYASLKQLIEESKKSNRVYPFFYEFADMLEDENSYVRNRGIALISENARWDVDYKVDEVIDQYLEHINDIKPITARQCVKGLEAIILAKEDLIPDIKKALYQAKVYKYASSMRELIEKDISNILKIIQKKESQV